MPSNRRIKVFFVLVLTLVIVTLFITSSHRAVQHNDFYDRTTAALEKGRAPPKMADMGGSDEDIARAMAERVQEAAKAAKDAANKKAPRPETPGEVVGMGNSAEGNKIGSTAGDRNVAGRKKYPIEDEVQAVIQEETEEEHEVEVELNAILKRSPIIIFSKTYCPYSKRAKGILLDEYSIVPAPFVVELDEHPLGSQLQAHLAKRTGRSTVPNILINGKSIGGSDEVAELASRRELVDKIKSMGGKRMVEVAQRASSDA